MADELHQVHHQQVTQVLTEPSCDGSEAIAAFDWTRGGKCGSATKQKRAT